MNALDAKIVQILLRNGRTGYDEIAKDCGVSKNKAWKRVMSMKKKGIINGATVQINFGHFGFAALATLHINVEAQQIEQVMDFIREITEVRSQRQYYSVYNVRAVATLRDLNELDHVKQVIKRKLPTIGLKTYIWTGIRNIPENLNLMGTSESNLKDNPSTSSKKIHVASEGIKIDKVDQQIVEKLTADGRTSFTRIAKEIGVSTDTVVKRYYKLTQKGSLKVSIQINPTKIGYTSILDFNVAFTAADTLLGTVVESFVQEYLM